MKIEKLFPFLIGIGFLLVSFPCKAQQKLSPEIQEMQQSARSYLQQKDYASSIMLLNQAINKAPDNVSLRRDLAYTYFLSGKVKKAEEVISPVIHSEFADEQTFQIAAAIENVLGKSGKAKRILKNGLEKFPQSGLLYNNLGNLYSADQDSRSALAAWEQGISVAPDFGRNYYAAAMTFQAKGKLVWALIYGEIYLNLSENPVQSNEIKKMMIATYQAIFTNGDNDNKLPAFHGKGETQSVGNTFVDCFRQDLLDNASVIRKGLNTETLTMLRTRFLMEWELKYARRFPFTLFSWQNKIVHAGFFDAYNQYLFGAMEDSQAFQLWIKMFSENYGDFQKWKQQNPLQPANYDPHP